MRKKRLFLSNNNLFKFPINPNTKMAELTCSSCKKRISAESAARFPCPACGKEEIVRCAHCREIAAKYKCHSCGFEGPN